MKVQALSRLAFACVALWLTPAHAESPAIETFTLANGLEVIVVPNHRVPAVSHMVWYRIGSADDPEGKSGLAHYHEHAMFLGTSHYKSGEYADIIARNGGEENAFTGYDATSYYININKENLPLAMDMEADRMRGITPSDADMTKERQVIIEERRTRVENNPDALLAEQVNAALFRNHPYHVPVIGWMHEMEGLNKDDVMKFHQTYYHPNNAILIISGDVTAKEVKPLAEKYYGVLPKVAVPPRVWKKEPPQNTERRITLHHKNVKQPSWSRDYIASSLGGYGNKDEVLPLFVLSQLLGEGKTSRLYQSLVVEQKIATGVATNYSGFNLGPSKFAVTVIPEKGVDLAVIEKAVDKEIARTLKEGFNETDIKRAKTQLKAQTIYARDGLTSMARIMGWLRICGLDKDYFTRWPDMIEAVTAQQITDGAKRTLIMNQSVTSLLLPEEEAKP